MNLRIRIADDEELIVLLAAHAAIAIANARLDERSRELSILSERNRLALELHDAVSQKLFSLRLTALRGYAALDASFGPGPQLVWGPNAAGKTSLLEAIVLLAWGASHRTSTDGVRVTGPIFPPTMRSPSCSTRTSSTCDSTRTTSMRSGRSSI